MRSIALAVLIRSIGSTDAKHWQHQCRVSAARMRSIGSANADHLQHWCGASAALMQMSAIADSTYAEHWQRQFGALAAPTWRIGTEQSMGSCQDRAWTALMQRMGSADGEHLQRQCRASGTPMQSNGSANAEHLQCWCRASSSADSKHQQCRCRAKAFIGNANALCPKFCHNRTIHMVVWSLAELPFIWFCCNKK